jgi:hypothetical protein
MTHGKGEWGNKAIRFSCKGYVTCNRYCKVFLDSYAALSRHYDFKEQVTCLQGIVTFFCHSLQKKEAPFGSLRSLRARRKKLCRQSHGALRTPDRRPPVAARPLVPNIDCQQIFWIFLKKPREAAGAEGGPRRWSAPLKGRVLQKGKPIGFPF